MTGVGKFMLRGWGWLASLGAVVLSLALAGPAAAASAGGLLAFGENQAGQLGNPTNNGTTNANPVPTAVSVAGQTGTVVQAAAGSAHSLVITSSGALYAFGDNHFGQLGIATNSGTTNANPVPPACHFRGRPAPSPRWRPATPTAWR